MNLYSTFDIFPSTKGASTHINEMIQAMSSVGDTRLLCLRGNDSLPTIQQYENITIKRYYTTEDLNYMERATLFSEEVFLEVEKLKEEIKIAQFRDIWSGLGVVSHPEITSIFEVNALTSIELPYRFPDLSKEFLNKIKELEQKCLDRCTHIVTPSSVTKNYLQVNYQINAEKISIIPNGAHQCNNFTRPTDAPEVYIIYFGAIQPWQGLDILIKAIVYLQDFENLKLVVCISTDEKTFRPYKKLIERLGIEDKIILKFKLSKQELHNYIHFAELSIAPLSACDRNIVQGCSPIKIFESMACKTAIIASDLPVTKEILSQGEALFFEPDRELDLATSVRFMLDHPDERKKRAENAYQKFKQEYEWEVQQDKMVNLYNKLIRGDKD